MLKKDVEDEIRAWMIDVMKRKGLRPYEVAWAFPWSLNPKNVERWVYGKRPQLPSLEAFVGFCLVVRELPPVLREFVLDDTETQT